MTLHDTRNATVGMLRQIFSLTLALGLLALLLLPFLGLFGY